MFYCSCEFCDIGLRQEITGDTYRRQVEGEASTATSVNRLTTYVARYADLTCRTVTTI